MNASSSLFGWLILLSSFDPPVWSASILQHTDGSCSPAVADVKGNVTITCNGMDQATVNKVISLLNEILKDRKKLDQIQQDLDKTTKRTDEIEARQASRRLTQNQSQQIVKLLTGKSSVPVEISVPIGNDEALQYAGDIGRALFSAGWKITKPIGTLQVMGSPTGILLRARDMGSPAAKSLLESLRSVGLDVKPIEQPDYDSDVIALIVGGKPL